MQNMAAMAASTAEPIEDYRWLVFLKLLNKSWVNYKNKSLNRQLNYHPHTTVLRAQFSVGGHFVWDMKMKYFYKLQSIF